MPSNVPEYHFIGHQPAEKGGLPLLHQLAPGRLHHYVLRFAAVNATSETVAKKIQVDYRKKKKKQRG